ncbi:MAG: glycoside hydrolase family 5 protein [Gemmatimonadota bacterium]|nr:glycoside hydrolase family 5 protein [Gemmatimonadota bacterium]
MMHKVSLVVVLGALTIVGVGCDSDSGLTPVIVAPTSHLGRGINLGNKLEAPSEGEWGAPVEAWMLTTIERGRFATVRIPTRWSAHAAAVPPYAIDAAFLDRVTWVVDQALSAGLMVVLNMHHYQEIFADPHGQRDRFLAVWQQIATHFRDYPDSLVFEVLNEPNTNLTPELWNAFLLDALAVIRQSNPDRYVMLGTGEWGGIGAMQRLQLPDDDRLIFTFHYYSPFEFTHQGAEWVSGSDAWLGTTWGTSQDRAAVQRDFDTVAAWAVQHDITVFMGEFGAYSRAAMDDRLAWTTFVRSEAERRGFSWAYWEFDAGFGAYRNGQWNELHEALIP